MYESALTVSVEFFRPEMITKKLPVFVEQLTSFFKKEPEVLTELGQLPNYSPIRRKVDAWDYADLREISCPIPAGLQVQYLGYFNALRLAVSINEKLLPEILTPYSRWIGELIEDPTKLQSLAGSKTVQAFEPHDIDGALASLGSCFQTGSNLTQKPFKVLFDRNADVKPVYENAKSLVEDYLKIPRKKVLAEVRGISELLTNLMHSLDSKTSDATLTDSSRTLLAKMTHTLAREVEFYAVVGYQLTQVSVALQGTSKAISA